MLTALGLAAVIVAGFALPLAMGGEPEDDGRDGEGDDAGDAGPGRAPAPEEQEAAMGGPQTGARGEAAPHGEAGSPLDVALSGEGPAAADADLSRHGTGSAAIPAIEPYGTGPDGPSRHPVCPHHTRSTRPAGPS